MKFTIMKGHYQNPLLEITFIIIKFVETSLYGIIKELLFFEGQIT